MSDKTAITMIAYIMILMNLQSKNLEKNVFFIVCCYIVNSVTYIEMFI